MASFPKMTTTNDGNLLLAKAAAGTTLTFTKIVLGDGQLNGQSISALHELISQKAFCDLSFGKRTDSTYQVGGLLLPDNITSGFYWREVGLLATDPDEGEILFAYANAGTATDYINPDTEDSRFEKNLYISIGVGAATNVTISVPSTDVSAMQDLSNVDLEEAFKKAGINFEEDLATHKKDTESHLTDGAQTFSGVKTFEESPEVPEPKKPENPIRKVDLENLTPKDIGAVSNLVDGNNIGAIRSKSSKHDYTMGEDAVALCYGSKAIGNNSFAAGQLSEAHGSSSHAEGRETTAEGNYSHAEGIETQATGNYSHAEGYSTTAEGDYSHAEGHNTLAKGNHSHVEGFGCNAIGIYSHAEGENSRATGVISHAEGEGTESGGSYSHAEGYGSKAIDRFSHAEGRETIATNECSHAEGYKTKASGSYSHAEGRETIASTDGSHAEGIHTIASGRFSHSGGAYTEANNFTSFVIGSCNKLLSGSPRSLDYNSDAFVIGNYDDPDARSNAFRVRYDGNVYGLHSFHSTGADYAEFFEWMDGNPDNEDRVGYFVTLNGDKIRKATEKDDYILGIVSVNPSVIGDSHEDDWRNKYVIDNWGRVQCHYVDVPEVVDEEGNVIEEARKDYVPILNPDWDNTQVYIPRENRKEWSAVGMMGKLLVRDDGTCTVNGYCKPNNDGIATKSNTGYRVIKRLSESIVQVLIR